MDLPPAESAPQRRTWSLWERRKDPPRLRLQDRDTAILEAFFDHQFLALDHVHCLFGTREMRQSTGSDTALAKRLGKLFHAGFLQRPTAAQPTRAATGRIVYALDRRGARHLEDHHRSAGAYRRIADRDWSRERSWPFVQHQLLVATVMVGVKVAAREQGIPFDFTPHYAFPNLIAALSAMKAAKDDPDLDPDGYFTLELPTPEGPAPFHHFLEVERDTRSGGAFHADRYSRYLAWWRSREQTGYRNLRVLTLTTDPLRMDSLRRIAAGIGRDKDHPRAWGGFWFSNFDRFTLSDPESIFRPIWSYAEGDRRAALLG